MELKKTLPVADDAENLHTRVLLLLPPAAPQPSIRFGAILNQIQNESRIGLSDDAATRKRIVSVASLGSHSVTHRETFPLFSRLCNTPISVSRQNFE